MSQWEQENPQTPAPDEGPKPDEGGGGQEGGGGMEGGDDGGESSDTPA